MPTNRSQSYLIKLTVLISLCLLCYAFSGKAQSRLYVTGGVSTVFGSGVNVLLGSDFSTEFNYLAFDVEYEKRVIGSFNFVTGVSLFNSGYTTTDDSFSSLSDFAAYYVAVPLMARWNVGNKNMFYLDFGLAPYYLVDAQLTESITEFGSTKTVSGDITEYSNRFYYASKFQMIILMNRFQIGMFMLFPAKGQSTLKDLEDHWGLNSQQSTYLLSNGFSDYQILGIKAGFRIR